MFKTLKWVYSLGRKYERNRIRKLIAEFTIQSQNRYRQFDLDNRVRGLSEDDPALRAKQKIEAKKRQVDIDHGVHDVLNMLQAGNPNYISEPVSPLDQEKL